MVLNKRNANWIKFMNALIWSYNHVLRTSRHPAAVHYWVKPTPALFKTNQILHVIFLKANKIKSPGQFKYNEALLFENLEQMLNERLLSVNTHMAHGATEPRAGQRINHMGLTSI